MIDWLIEVFGPWSRADWLSLGQLLFTAGGFWLAIRQLKRTATAAELTTERIAGLQRRLLGNDLLIALPEVQKLGDLIDSAIKAGDQERTESALRDYARAAHASSAMISTRPEQDEQELIKRLDAASKGALKAQEELVKAGGGDFAVIARKAIGKISTASVEIGAAIARLQRKDGGDESTRV